jgi:hypothetical protein
VDGGMLARHDRAVGSLLTWCVRQTTGPEPSQPPTDLAAVSSAAWSELLREATRHMILPICWRALEPFRDQLPAALGADLASAFEQNTRRNLWLTGELLSILARLRNEGVEAVPWKGPLLAQRAYGDIRLRQFFDLDVLVRHTDLASATRMAIASGFKHEKHMTEHERETYVEHQGEVELVRDTDGLWLELHTKIVPTYYGRTSSADGLWERTLPAQLGRAVVPGLDLVDEFEALCIHGSKHRWDRLAWIADIAVAGRRFTDEDWARLFARSVAHGSRRMVNLALLLAVDVCAAYPPSWVVTRARSDRAAGRLAVEVQRDLFHPQPSPFDALLFHARMRERSRDQLQYLFSVLFTPSGADWEALALPRPLFPLYALTRPVRLAVKYGSRVFLGRDADRTG